MYGTLYGIGVGPGASDLLTLRAVEILGRVDVVLAAASPRNAYSMALETARPHINPQAEIVRLEFPMTRDTTALQQAWHQATEQTAAVLALGKSAAFVTIGDPLIYSTFGYLLRTLRSKATCRNIPVEIVPGITSFQAAAAKTHTVLCEGEETLLLLSGITNEEDLTAGLQFADTSVILKAYKNFPAIRQALEQTHCADTAVFVSKICQKGETIYEDLHQLPDIPPYLSLVLAKRPKK